MKEIAGTLSAAGMRFGIVVSRFNSFFTEQLLKGAERLLKSGKYDAVLALGCVIQGATPHADLIEQQVARSLTQLGLQYDKPVTGGLVAANSLEQAVERSGTKMGNKGWDAAMAAIEMASVFKQL